MSVSGSQFTRIGTSSAVGIAITITAKAASGAIALINQARSISRFVFSRVFGRIN